MPSRPASDEEIPRVARSLIKAADSAGWRHLATYAHGFTIGAQGEPGRAIQSVVVRLRRDPLAAVGVWHDGKFSTAYVWSKFTAPRPIGARGLARFVKEPAA